MAPAVTAQTELLDQIVHPRGRRIVDVGCGDGWLVRRLASRGATVVGVEPAQAALAAARAAPAVAAERYLHGAAEDLPLDDASCDVVIFFNSLHHVAVEQLDRALAEAVRVCARDGMVFVQEPVAEGSFFELMQPVDDETAVRAAAQAALERAADRDGVNAEQQTFTPEVRMASFEAWREHQLLVDPEREGPLRAAEPRLRERFVALGVANGDGWRFDAPARVTLLRRVGA